MKVGVTLEDDRGLNSNVSAHFGQCSHFLIVDIEKAEIQQIRVVPNFAQHGGGGCTAVEEVLKHNITHVIAGGMGAGAQNKFAEADVQIFGYSGKAQDAIACLIKDSLGGLEACREQGKHHKEEEGQ